MLVMKHVRDEVQALAEKLYVEAMRDGSREARGLPVDAEFWEEEARIMLSLRDLGTTVAPEGEHDEPRVRGQLRHSAGDSEVVPDDGRD